MNSYPSSFPGQGVPGGVPGMTGGVPGQGVPGAVPSSMVPPANVDAATKKGKGKSKDPKDPKDPKPTTKRAVTNYKIGAALAVLAALAAYFLFNQAPPSTFVVRAASPIPALTPVDASQLTATEVPLELVEVDAVTGETAEEAIAKAVDGINGVTQNPIAGGEQIQLDQFASSEVELTEGLAADERLVSVSATVARSVAGTIRPNDRVDVIAVAGGEGEALANVVAYDVPVVSITPGEAAYDAAASAQAGEAKDKKASELLPGAPIPGIYVVRVPATQAARLAAIDAGATVYLSYRGPEATNVKMSATSILDVICSGDPQVQDTTSNSPLCSGR